MRVIDVTNVCHAYVAGMQMLERDGVWEETRNGPALVMQEPMTTVYREPRQRVLLAPGRVPNPVFHLFEALWMLAGRSDAKFLDQFVSDFSSRFAEDSGLQHGAYGGRWRCHFPLESAGTDKKSDLSWDTDQLDVVVRRLRKDPQDRRVVVQMWDPEVDLGADKRDLPCNLTALPRVVGGRLDLTVFCRSNDAVWGAYGANAVHFSVLQEYLAARVGVPVGVYRQVSNNLHVYEDQLRRTPVPTYVTDVYSHQGTFQYYPLVADPDAFDDEAREFLQHPSRETRYRNEFLPLVARPMWFANQYRLGREWREARRMASATGSSDWRMGTLAWIHRLEGKR